jgi:hypothetical protein
MKKNTNIFVALCLVIVSARTFASKPLAVAVSAVTKSKKEFIKPACPTRPAPKRPDTPNTPKYAKDKAFQQKRWSVILSKASAPLPVHHENKSDDTLPATGPAFAGLIPVPMGSDAETIQAESFVTATK